MLFSFVGRILALYNINNMIFYNVFTPIEYSFLAYTLSDWQPNAHIRKMSLISIPIFVIFVLLLKIQIEDISQFDHISTSLEALLLTGFSISALYRLLKSENISLWNDSSSFVIFAILIYFAGNSIIFAYSSNIDPILWLSIHTSIGIIAKIAYSWSYLCLTHK